MTNFSSPTVTHNLHLIRTIKVAFDDSVYIMDSVLSSDGCSMAFTTSNQIIKTYDVRTGAHTCDLTAHTAPITDIVASPVQPKVLLSCQQDTGVMISDLRVAKPIHFLTEMTQSGQESYSLSVSPCGDRLALAVNGDIHVVDTRTWTSVQSLLSIHSDEITRLRFCGDNLICSAGEDHLVNVMDFSLPERDMMVDCINLEEAVHKMQWFPQHSCVTITGSMENSWIIPLGENNEIKIPRRDFDTYCVDFTSVNNQCLGLIMGKKYEDSVGPLEIISCQTESWGNSLGYCAKGHKEITRCALTLPDRLITGGDDGTICIWDTNCQIPPPCGLNTLNEEVSSSADLSLRRNPNINPLDDGSDSSCMKATHGSFKMNENRKKSKKPY